ncbi:MAG TPA: hypothetical protein PLJ47_03125 [Candidatus Hydrogenedentes bacterium]|nr:hypothetical protein [Candidatus Hydrogenedentota bacterium]
MSHEKTKRRLHPILWLIGILLAVVAGSLAWSMFSLRSTVSAIRANNEPTTMEELDAWYRQVPEEQNAALLVLQAIESFQPGESDALVPYATKLQPDLNGAPFSAEVRVALAGHLADNKEALELLARAVDMPGSRYPVFLPTVLQSGLPHLEGIRGLARLYAAEAVFKADQEDARGACEAIMRNLKLADTLQNEPILISQLVRVAIQGLALESAEYVVNRAPIESEELTALQDAVLRAEDPELLYRALVGERCFSTNFSGAQSGQAPFMSAFGRIASSYFQAGMQRSMTEAVDASRLPEMERRTRFNEIEVRLGKTLNPLVSMLVPNILRSSVTHDHTTARIRVAAAAIAVERYRIASGKLPDSLDALVPRFLESVPQDPFDGAPLRYIREDKGFAVYSIGENMTDEGGLRGSKRGVGDEVFSVGR